MPAYFLFSSRQILVDRLVSLFGGFLLLLLEQALNGQQVGTEFRKPGNGGVYEMTKGATVAAARPAPFVGNARSG